MNSIIQIGNIRKGTLTFDNPQSGRIYSSNGICPTLNTCQGGGLEPKVITKMNTEEVKNSIDNSKYAIRKLIPLECNRLMGFPDWVHKKQKEVGISDSQIYKQAGNSIVTAPLYYIFRNLHEVMPYLFDDLKVGSYFSGVGAFEMALNMLYSEINYGTPMVWFEHGGDTSDEYAEQ